MSIENEGFIALMEDKQFVEKMLSQAAPEDVQRLFTDSGVELTMEEVMALGAELERQFHNQNGELDENALEGVNGGVIITAATGWAIAKAVIAVGSAGLAIYKWYKSR